MSSQKSTGSPSAGDQIADCLHLRPVGRGKQPKFYTIEQIADCLAVSTRTVRRWIEYELLVVHRFNGSASSLDHLVAGEQRRRDFKTLGTRAGRGEGGGLS